MKSKPSSFRLRIHRFNFSYLNNFFLNFIYKDFDRCDCQIYESVARMPPFKRKMLVLIGAIGVGRDSLLKRLIKTVNLLEKKLHECDIHMYLPRGDSNF